MTPDERRRIAEEENIRMNARMNHPPVRNLRRAMGFQALSSLIGCVAPIVLIVILVIAVLICSILQRH